MRSCHRAWDWGSDAARLLRDYEAQKKAGVAHYVFDPKALGIKNAKFWEDRKAGD